MSDNKICFGHSFALPYESGSATIARILQCNPTRSLDYLTYHCKQSLTCSSRFDISMPTLGRTDYSILRQYFYQTKNSQTSKYWSVGYDHCVHHSKKPYYRKYNCSQCAKAHYHSCMYDLSCVSYCPIHGEELSSTCPDCSMPWKKGIEQYSKKCSTCGLYKSVDDFMTQRKRLSRQSFKKMDQWYDNFIYFEPKEVAHFFDIDSPNGLVSSETLLDHKNISILKSNKLLCKADSRLRKTHNILALSTKRFQLSKVSTDSRADKLSYKYSSGTLINLEKPLVDARKRTFYKMYGAHTGGLTMFDYASPNYHLNREINGCSYCEDFCIWLVLTVMPHSFKSICKYTRLHPDLYKNETEVLPEPPFPRRYVTYKNQTFELSLNAQSFIYELELAKFFSLLSFKLGMFNRYYHSDNYYNVTRTKEHARTMYYEDLSSPPFFTIKNSSLYVTYFTYDFHSEPTLLNVKVKRKLRKLEQLFGIMLITEPDASNPYEQFDTLVKEYSDYNYDYLH